MLQAGDVTLPGREGEVNLLNCKWSDSYHLGNNTGYEAKWLLRDSSVSEILSIGLSPDTGERLFCKIISAKRA